MQNARRSQVSWLLLGLFALLILVLVVTGLAWFGGEQKQSQIIVPVASPNSEKSLPSD
jgi:uncharacterized iron-regulated membrane protein